LSGWTGKPGFDVRSNAKAITAICAKDDGVIRLLPSLNSPGLAAGTSSMIASADVRKVFQPKPRPFLGENSRIFRRKLPEIH
jgi:hypothetical protein